MLRFSEYLPEARKAAKELKNVEDAKGKLFEILAGSYLLHGKHPKTGMPNKFLEHYRDEDGFRPEEVHDKIKSFLQKKSPGLYEQIVGHSHDAAQHLTNELRQRGMGTINNLAWTSQKGDHERFTGVDDPNSDADLMAKGSNERNEQLDPLGLSMKYGKQKDPNLRGNGLDALEQLAGLKKGDLEGLREKHYDHIRSHGIGTGISGDAEYKALSAKEHPIAKSIDDHALQTQQEMSKRFSNGLGKLSSEDLRTAIKKIIAPETKYQHLRHHTQVNNDGSANHETHDVQDHANKTLGDYEEFRVRPHSGGISTVIEGRRKGADNFETAMQIGMKKSRTFSGRGFNSFTKAPMLRKGRKTKASKKPSIADVPVKKATRAKAQPVAAQQPVAAPVQQVAAPPPAPVAADPGGFGKFRGEGPIEFPAAKNYDPHQHKQFRVDEVGGRSWRGPGE